MRGEHCDLVRRTSEKVKHHKVCPVAHSGHQVGLPPNSWRCQRVYCAVQSISKHHRRSTPVPPQIWDTALRMLCKYWGLQDPPHFKEFMEIQVGTLARKPVRARCGAGP